MLKLCRNSRGTTFRNPFQSELECHLLEVEIQEVCWRKLNDIVLSTEGVQLLCLIDKGLDACRYLQTYGEWDSAAWLAKVKLHFLSRYKCLFSASLVSLQKSIFVETLSSSSSSSSSSLLLCSWLTRLWSFQATLNYPDCAEVMRRWVEHLSSTHTSQQVT